MTRYLISNMIIVGFVVSFLCAACSLTDSAQTPGVVIDGRHPVSNPSDFPTSTLAINLTLQKSSLPTETEEPTLSPSPTNTVTVIPSREPSFEIIINSAKEEVGTLFVGTDGSIVRRLALGLELSAVRGASYMYRARSTSDGTEIEVDKIDFYGNVEERREIAVSGMNSSPFFFNYSISPDGKWITYMHGDNAYDPHLSLKIDLWLFDIELREGIPFAVTKNHRSTNEPVSWNSVGNLFIYADKDENGIVQLYEMHTATQKTTQVTHFDESFRGQWIYQAKISPDDRRIAFTTQSESGLGKVGVVGIDDKQVIWMQIPSGGYQPVNNPLWWNRIGSQIMVLIAGIQASNANDSRIIWYDAASGNAIKTFPEIGQPPQSIEHAFPVNDIDVVGFWGYDPEISDKQYWLYDSKSKNLNKIDLPDLGLTRYQFIQLDNEQ